MATITKLQRPDGVVYKARVRRQGQQGQVSKTFSTRKAAERWALKFEASIDEDNAGLTPAGRKHTLTEAIARYRREILPSKSATTQPNYERLIAYWETTLGHLRLSEITPERIATCRDDLLSSPKPPRRAGAPPTYRTPATVHAYLAVLGAVLTACIAEWHWLKTSPMLGVSKPTVSNARSRFLTQEELDRLLIACRESESPDLYLAVLLSITTGARQGEILGLHWRDVDLDKGVVHLRVGNETTTKGGVRSLPIAPQALTILKERKQAQKVVDLAGLGFVFPSRVTRTKPVELKKPWSTALKRAGIDGFRWHDLRHSAASFMAAHGASLLEIGCVLGHKSAQTTKRYAHLTESATHDLVRVVSGKLLGGE
jgi:integrase